MVLHLQYINAKKKPLSVNPLNFKRDPQRFLDRQEGLWGSDPRVVGLDLGVGLASCEAAYKICAPPHYRGISS